jgi:hypothetical protein
MYRYEYNIELLHRGECISVILCTKYYRKTWSLRPTECFGFSTFFRGRVYLLPKC